MVSVGGSPCGPWSPHRGYHKLFFFFGGNAERSSRPVPTRRKLICLMLSPKTGSSSRECGVGEWTADGKIRRFVQCGTSEKTTQLTATIAGQTVKLWWQNAACTTIDDHIMAYYC